MRVSAATKAITRQQILRTAKRLFVEKGFDATRTRDIAYEADLASGTIFNYFPSKEAIVACLAAEAVGEVELKRDAPRGNRTLEEDLFALVAEGMRRLKPLRKHLSAVIETSLNPLVDKAGDDVAAMRVKHLQAVAACARAHGVGELSSTALQLYWTLYVGVLAFWAADASPRQEDTLALLDDSINMFIGWLRDNPRG